MLTNRLGLPAALVRAVSNDPYTRGSSDISTTQLIAPPYQRKLRETVEPNEDASDRIWSLLGQAVHAILERAYPEHQPDDDILAMQEFYARTGYLRENRLYAGVQVPSLGRRTVSLSGAFDVYESGVMKDYKVTSVWSVIGDTKVEWEQQLNILRWLAAENCLPVPEGLQIIAILRDWSQMKAKVDREYPQLPVAVVDIPVWELDRVEEFIEQRMALHFADEPAVCSDEERWKTEDVFAVMKEGRKSAVKLHDSQDAADLHAGQLGKGHSVVLRPGEYRRCSSYCNVAHACPAWVGVVPF